MKMPGLSWMPLKQAQRRSLLVTTALFVIPLCVSGAAHAQLEQQTIIADPGRAQERLLDDSAFAPTGAPINVKNMELLGVPAGAENIKLGLRSVTVEGASSLPESEIHSVYADKVGSEITLADVYQIANEITLKYREEGYILTQVVVPPQVIDSGNVKLQAVEGFVDKVNVQAPEGESEAAMNLIRAHAARLANGGALNNRDLERHLLLINDLPGISARSILSPSTTTPGAADITIMVERDPLDGMAGIDNFGSRYLGPVNLSGALTTNSMLGWNESLTAQVVVAPQGGQELAYGSLKYEMPIGTYGTKGSILASVADTDPGYDLSQFEVRGLSQLISLRIEHPFIRSRNENLSGYAGFDWKNVRSSNNVELTRKDKIRALRFGGDYDFLDTIMGIGFNAFGVEISRGLDIMGASDEGDANLTRAQGDPQFTKITLEAQRLQRITNKVNLLVKAEGQMSDGPLLSSEEFGVGGIANGRGYDPSEIVGDEGMAGKVELQWNNPWDYESQWVNKVQLYSFFDAGRIWNDDATTSATKSDTLTSAGLGTRIKLTGDVDTGLAVAFPLNRDVQTQGDKDPKVYFNLNKRF